MVEVSLTVGKLDASLALLLTKDHHLIEFPTILLPDGVKAGSVVKIKCENDFELEAKEKDQFEKVQQDILMTFGQSEPEKPILKLRNITQTSCVLEWEPLQLSTASIKSLTLYKNGQRLGQIPNPLINTTTKLSGLPVDTPYKFSLRLDTTAGTYFSNEIDVRTHKMSDLSGITVCLGEIDWEKEGFDKKDLEDILKSINAKPLQEDVMVDTTHFVCTLEKGSKWKKAVDNNIPVVRPEWLKACDSEKRIVGVRMFYLDSNTDVIKQHKIVHGEKRLEKKSEKPVQSNESQTFDEVPLTDSDSGKETTNKVEPVEPVELKEVVEESKEELKEEVKHEAKEAPKEELKEEIEENIKEDIMEEPKEDDKEESKLELEEPKEAPKKSNEVKEVEKKVEGVKKEVKEEVEEPKEVETEITEVEEEPKEVEEKEENEEVEEEPTEEPKDEFPEEPAFETKPAKEAAIN